MDCIQQGRKKDIRRHIRDLKMQVGTAEKRSKAASVWAQIARMEHFQHAKTLLLYWSMPDELCTHGFILRRYLEKTILLPVIDGDSLKIKYFEGPESLKRHASLNLYEPQGRDYKLLQQIDIVIVPGIAFDKERHRLGRGKGYYDQLLPTLNAYKIGVGFDFQLLEHVPCEAHDILMDEVVVA
jgi:5-formyltetrahydrofolate cyclo-ligase